MTCLKMSDNYLAHRVPVAWYPFAGVGSSCGEYTVKYFFDF
jgi:hypothetical protein